MKKELIQVKSLSKRFTKEAQALYDIHLDVEAGDIFGIVGTSGAGKSTLMRCLTGLDRPSSGSILIEGEEITQFNQKQQLAFRKRMGMIFQHFNLFPSRTVAENIAFPMEVHGTPLDVQKARIDELLNLVGLSAKKGAYPANLSGGEKQRVGIARALANRPDLLLCDEPTSALDPTSTRVVLDLLQKLNRELGLTIVVITHQMEIVKQICNKVAVLSHGHLVESGSVLNVFSHPKHQATKQLLHPLVDELPPDFAENLAPNHRLVTIHFRGDVAHQPIISRMIKQSQVEANILLGRMDRVQKTTLGTLLVELGGTPDQIEKALDFLETSKVDYEVMI